MVRITENFGKLKEPFGHLKINSLFQVHYRHPKSHRYDKHTNKWYTVPQHFAIYDCAETQYHYALGKYDSHTSVFTIDYLIHYSDFAKMIAKNIIRVVVTP